MEDYAKHNFLKDIEVEGKIKPLQNFTDGFVGAMALVGIITIGYQLVKLFISLVK